MRYPFKYIFLILSALYIFATSSYAQVTRSWLEENYHKSEVMIPMRDGISLYTAVYSPVHAEGRPVIMTRTPYSCAPYGDGWHHDLTGKMSEFVQNEYIVVYQDVRGRFMSGGEFMNVRPYNPYKQGAQTDEASDTYDTIEWLLANTSNNGAVGVIGMSYPGFYATMAALSGHPALKAVSPQAPILDWYKGDDAHHNGALMLLDLYSFSTYMFKEHDNPRTEDKGLESPIGDNAYEWFLEQKTPARLTAMLPEPLAFWNEVLAHPHYDDYWQERSLEQHLNDIKPAILVVGGSFDTDDCYGALNTYKLIRDNSPKTDLHFVYGPWCHGCWHSTTYKGLGEVSFPEGLGETFMKDMEYPFFRYYLEGKGTRPDPVRVFCSGGDEWKSMDVWAPSDMPMTPVYLGGDSTISLSAPLTSDSYSSYVSDPSSPVPFMEDASRRNRNYMAADQTFASKRNDVLTFTSTPTDTVIVLEGPIKVELDISLSTSDADIVVKLIDVNPDGYQMLLRGDVFPVRYRNSFSNPGPVEPGQIFSLDFTMNDIAHHLNPGHRLMVQIQSTWFPIVNPSPQTYMDNIYEATAEDYRTAEIRVHHSASNPSRLLLPVR